MKLLRSIDGFTITDISFDEMRQLETILCPEASGEVTELWEDFVRHSVQCTTVSALVGGDSDGKGGIWFDAAKWFRKAKPVQILALAKRRWQDPLVAIALRGDYPEVAKFIDADESGKPQCRISSGAAMTWLAHYRPTVYGTILEQNLFNGGRCRLCNSPTDYDGGCCCNEDCFHFTRFQEAREDD